MLSTKTNTRVLFNEHPTDYPIPDRTVVLDKSQTIDLDNAPLGGGVLAKLLVISIDPYLRGLMNKKQGIQGYIPGYKLNEPIFTSGVQKVLRSEHSGYEVGDFILSRSNVQEYNILTPDDLKTASRIDNKHNLPLSVFIGAAGMPGQTAYYGYHEFFKLNLKKGDTIFITTGGGPVGSFVIQLAKADGLKVIASAGSEEKVNFMKICGADVAFNYKTTSTKEILDEHGPINFYWDHVGGEVLDLAMEAAAPCAHFIECGLITGYNGAIQPLKNYSHILWKQLKLYGFLVGAYHEKYRARFMAEVPQWIAEGKIKYTEDKRIGLDSVGQTFFDVQKGNNKGKAIVVVSGYYD